MPDFVDETFNLNVYHFILLTFAFGGAASQFCFLANWSGLFSPGTWLMPAAHIYFYFPFCMALADGRYDKSNHNRFFVWWVVNFFCIEATWLMNGTFWEEQQLWLCTPLLVAVTLLFAWGKHKFNKVLSQQRDAKVWNTQEVPLEESTITSEESTGTTTQLEMEQASRRSTQTECVPD